MSRPERSLLAQLGIGVLPLKIETGRYNNVTVVEDRICELCDLDIEDENHFVCSCPIYSQFLIIQNLITGMMISLFSG